MTLPYSKSLSINMACSSQYGCSRLVFPETQASPGVKKITKVFFMGFLSIFVMFEQISNKIKRTQSLAPFYAISKGRVSLLSSQTMYHPRKRQSGSRTYRASQIAHHRPVIVKAQLHCLPGLTTQSWQSLRCQQHEQWIGRAVKVGRQAAPREEKWHKSEQNGSLGTFLAHTPVPPQA